MELSFTAEQEALRQELRSWLHANLPWEYGVGLPPRFDNLEEEVAFLRQWQGTLAGGLPRHERHAQLPDADDDGPRADPDRQRQGGDVRPGDGDDTGGDVEEGEQQVAGDWSRLFAGEGADALADGVEEDGDGKDHHDGADGHPRPGEGDDAHHDGQQTAQEQGLR